MRTIWPMLLLSMSAPTAALAQASTPDAGVLRLFQGDFELGREQFRSFPGGFDQSVVIPVINLKVASHVSYGVRGEVNSFETRIFNAAGDSLRGTVTGALEGDSVRIESTIATIRGGYVPARASALMPPQSLASIAELASKAAGRDTVLEVLAIGVDSLSRMTLRFSGDTARVLFGGLEVQVLRSKGQLESIQVPAQRVQARRAAESDSLPALGLKHPTPNYAAPAGAGFTADEVRIPVQPAAGDSFSLACTLTRPKTGRPPFPAMVTITGSGSQARDEDLWPLLPDYRLFGQIAERLGNAGIATLRCDDRGAGSSGGNPSKATSRDLADDTRQTIDWLRRQQGIDPKRIGVVGHSEGGLIGPMIAADDRTLAAVVVLAGPGKRGVDILVDQAKWPILTQSGLAEDERQKRLAEAERVVRADTANALPWLRWFRTYDPIPAAKRVRQPVLILQGAFDRQVSAGQADTLAAAMRDGGNRDVTVRIFPRLNHLFLISPTDGSPSEYVSLRDVAIPGEVLETLTVWLAQRLKR